MAQVAFLWFNFEMLYLVSIGFGCWKRLVDLQHEAGRSMGKLHYQSQVPDQNHENMESLPLPICSMYGIFTYIWLVLMVNVGKYTIHGASGLS